MALINRHLLHQFTKFITVGLLNTLCNYLLFLFLLNKKIDALISGASGFTLGALIGFSINRKWTFGSNINYKNGLYKYMLVQLFCLLVHSSTQLISIKFLAVPEVFSQLTGIVVTTFLNFILIKKIIFTNKDEICRIN